MVELKTGVVEDKEDQAEDVEVLTRADAKVADPAAERAEVRAEVEEGRDR